MDKHKTPPKQPKIKLEKKKNRKIDKLETPKKPKKTKAPVSKSPDLACYQIIEEINEEVSEKSSTKIVEQDLLNFSSMKGNFESGNKPRKIIKSLLIEGKVLYDIEWESEGNNVDIENTLISEDILRKNIQPQLFTKLVNDYLLED